MQYDYSELFILKKSTDLNVEENANAMHLKSTYIVHVYSLSINSALYDFVSPLFCK